jgi:hypothetical protein
MIAQVRTILEELPSPPTEVDLVVVDDDDDEDEGLSIVNGDYLRT